MTDDQFISLSPFYKPLLRDARVSCLHSARQLCARCDRTARSHPGPSAKFYWEMIQGKRVVRIVTEGTASCQHPDTEEDSCPLCLARAAVAAMALSPSADLEERA